MKKLFSISLALLILISGMHVTFAAHICGGEVAAVKWSLSSEQASCSMESHQQTAKANQSVASNCCHNKVAVYAVDNNYQPSPYQANNILKHADYTIAATAMIFSPALSTFPTKGCFAAPPNLPTVSRVSLPMICVFRI